MTKTYPQELHALFASVVADPSVAPSSVVMEAMHRAFKLGRDKMTEAAALMADAAEYPDGDERHGVAGQIANAFRALLPVQPQK